MIEIKFKWVIKYDVHLCAAFLTVPSHPPLSVKAKVFDNNTMKVSWQPPPEQDHNGPLLGYKVSAHVPATVRVHSTFNLL